MLREKSYIKKLKNKKEKREKVIVKKGEISRRKQMKIFLWLAAIIFSILAIRTAWIQFVQGNELKDMAYTQQTLDRRINPRRGTIYDATGKTVLATSSNVETITINPLNISSNDKEKVAKELSELFNLDYDKILKKVNKKVAIESVVKKVDKEKADELRKWMNTNNITYGINIDEDTKRYYPFNNLAAQVLGFCGSDNQGLGGVEAIYDKELAGQQGKILKMTNARGIDIKNATEDYQKPVDGNDIVLTIDATVQGIAEKYLEEACIDNQCTDGGNIIIMNVKNGDILAMAGYPKFNLNDPYTINVEELKSSWETLTATERADNLQKMWRNKAISDTYEPGSTFKLVTASAALEEGIVTSPDNEGEFCCNGYIEVAGVKMKCWRYYRPHGPESLRQALMNSCNPIFIGLGEKIGVSKYYEYLNKFGFLKKTGIDLPGEAKGIFLAEKKVGPVELGTIAFGQRFEVTPIQMITMVSTIANGGTYIQPRVVKEIINNQTGEVKEIEPIKQERVISEQTAKNIVSMMGSVVAEGTGKNAQVKGYSLGGKTGTSEDGVNTGKYIASFEGIATVSDPNIAILITLYNPKGEGGHSGGGIGAPIASQVLSEVLPYLDINKDNESDDENSKNIEEINMPNVLEMSPKEAKKILEDAGLQVNIQTTDETKKETTESSEDSVVSITEQLPKAGIKIKKGTTVIIK